MKWVAVCRIPLRFFASSSFDPSDLAYWIVCLSKIV
jgi:hypothetical protein